MRPETSLDAAYFEGIFAGDDDPWHLASSGYEAAKFDATIAAIADRRYRRAIEVGCAQGILTERLAPLCEDLLAVDISATALARARERCRDLPSVRFARRTVPREVAPGPFDLILLSEVVYYWDNRDLRLAADWLHASALPGGRLLLVHWTGETDYPQSGDDAVAALRAGLGAAIDIKRADRTADYRLDLWRRR